MLDCSVSSRSSRARSGASASRPIARTTAATQPPVARRSDSASLGIQRDVRLVGGELRHLVGREREVGGIERRARAAAVPAVRARQPVPGR